MVVIVAEETVVETESSAGSERRCIGLDVHREFAQVAVWQGGLVIQAGRFATTPEGVRAFAEGLGPGDEVALEATGNTWAIATLLASRAGRVVVSNPAKTRAIAEAKVKTDKVDAEIWRSCWPRITCRRCGARTRPPLRCAARCCGGRTSCANGPG
jgi:transposase